MSLRYEQYWSLKKTQAFLREILAEPHKHWTAKTLKAKASSCLKHYPHLDEQGEPFWSRDSFTKDRNRQNVTT